MGCSDSRPPAPYGLWIPRQRCRRLVGPDCGARALPLLPLSPHAATGDFSAPALATRADPRPGTGSPRFLERSFGARPPQPPRMAPRVHGLLATPQVADFPISGRLVAITSRNEAESGSLSLGSRLRRLGSSSPSLPGTTPVTGLLSELGYPHTEVRSYVPKEKFARLFPFKQVESSRLGLAHQRNAETRRGLSAVLCASSASSAVPGLSSWAPSGR